jgi:hypothetical protein
VEGRILFDTAPESRQTELQCNNKVTGKQNLDVITRTIYFHRTNLIGKPVMRERPIFHPLAIRPRLCTLEENYNTNTSAIRYGNSVQSCDTTHHEQGIELLIIRHSKIE